MHIQSFHRLAQPSCPTIVAYISFYACAVSAGFPSPADDCAPCNALFALRAKALLTWVKTVRERVPYLRRKSKGTIAWYLQDKYN